MRLVAGFMRWLGDDSAAQRERPSSAVAPRRQRQAQWPPAAPLGMTEQRRAMAASTRRSSRRGAALPQRRIIRTSGVTGAAVFSVSGERCGRICDLSIDKQTGHIVYALIAVEGDLGFLQRVCPVPWALLRYDGAKRGYVAPAERIDLTVGPPITAEELRHMGAGEEAWQQRLAIFYNPYPALPFI